MPAAGYVLQGSGGAGVFFAGAGYAGHSMSQTKPAGRLPVLWSHLHGIKGTRKKHTCTAAPLENIAHAGTPGFLHGRLVSRQVMEEFRRKRKRT